MTSAVLLDVIKKSATPTRVKVIKFEKEGRLFNLTIKLISTHRDAGDSYLMHGIVDTLEHDEHAVQR